MANAGTESTSGLIRGSRPMDVSKALAALLAEEGMMLAVLVFAFPTPLSLNWGLAFSLAGLAILAWEQGYTQRLPEIVGPYRFVRNPHSLALWMISFGLALAARSFPAVVLSLVLLPWLFYLDHEENLARPDLKLLRYRFQVPALIPTLIPFDRNPKASFSWRHAVKVQRWGSQSRLLATLLIWAYILVSFKFNLPYWGGIILTAAYIGIKLLLGKGKVSAFAFRKKA